MKDFNYTGNNNFNFLLILILTLCELLLLNYTGGADRIIHEFDYFSNAVNQNLKYDWFLTSITKLKTHEYYNYLIDSINYNLKISEYLRLLLFFIFRFLFYYSSVHILQLLGLTLSNTFFALLTIICIDTHSFFNPWLYSQLIFLDSGLSPRLISISIGYYSLYRLLLYINFHNSINLYISAMLLGAATLFHVSNSFLIFILFFATLFVHYYFVEKRNVREYFTLIIFLLLFLIGGGWFAINQVLNSISTTSNIETSYFIWLWVYFRAPYLRFDSVNPVISGSFFTIIFLVTIIILLFNYNYKRFKCNNNIHFISIVFFISLLLFFSFFFSINFNSSLLFNLYGIRQISILKFISLFFLFLILQLFLKNHKIYLYSIILLLFFISLKNNFSSSLMSYKNILYNDLNTTSKIKRLQNICKGEVLVEYDFPVSKFLIPTFVDFKKFGVNKYYMNEWQMRLNEIYNNQILQEYKKQKASNNFSTFSINSDNSIFLNKSSLINFVRKNKISFLLLKNYKPTTSNFLIVDFYNDYTLYKFNNLDAN